MEENKIPKILVIGNEGDHKLIALAELAKKGEIELCFYMPEHEELFQTEDYDLVVCDPESDVFNPPQHNLTDIEKEPKIRKEPKHKKPWYNNNRW